MLVGGRMVQEEEHGRHVASWGRYMGWGMHNKDDTMVILQRVEDAAAVVVVVAVVLETSENEKRQDFSLQRQVPRKIHSVDQAAGHRT